MSDALHDFGDSLSLGLAHYFEKKSTKLRDEDFSYGYKRFSLIGAFINSIVLIIGSVFIVQEAISRLITPQPANAKGMLILAVIGVAVNLIAMLRLSRGTSVNERVVSLHFLEDVLGWVAVLVGSIIMMFYNVPILDPILSLLIAVFILFNVYRNLKQAFPIMLQGIPDNVDVEEIKKRILSIPGIINVHDLHAWTMDGRYNVMTIHIVLEQATSMEQTDRLKQEVRHQLEHLNVQHLTVETELQNNPCELKDC
jgi:cobalt-zinc-cadmium efflux system protein